MCVCGGVSDLHNQFSNTAPLSPELRLRRLYRLQSGKTPQKECPGHDTKLYPMVRLQFSISGKYEIPLHCHYSNIHSKKFWADYSPISGSNRFSSHGISIYYIFPLLKKEKCTSSRSV